MRTSRSSLFAAVFATWMIIVFFCAGRLGLTLLPHPGLKPDELQDWIMMKELHLLLGSCLVSAILAALLHRKPFLLRVEERMCSFGTGVAQLTMVVYAAVLPFCLAMELASVLSGKQLGSRSRGGKGGASDLPPEIALLLAQDSTAAKEELDMTPATRCTQCHRAMPKGKKACMYCGPTLPLRI